MVLKDLGKNVGQWGVEAGEGAKDEHSEGRALAGPNRTALLERLPLYTLMSLWQSRRKEERKRISS